MDLRALQMAARNRVPTPERRDKPQHTQRHHPTANLYPCPDATTLYTAAPRTTHRRLGGAADETGGIPGNPGAEAVLDAGRCCRTRCMARTDWDWEAWILL